MSRSLPVHPLIVALSVAFGVMLLVRWQYPTPRREVSAPSLWSRRPAPPRQEESSAQIHEAPRPWEMVSPFDDWYRDEGDPGHCGFDLPLNGNFDLRLAELAGAWPQLGTLDLLILAWTSRQYQLNPHFLLGIMQAESGGDCSAVSVAGAQGCFQITDTMGAQQLANSYPERVGDWYWARRRLTRTSGTPWPPEGRNSDYYPRELYIDPEVYFQAYEPPPGRRTRGRQLRRLIDPVATLVDSSYYGSLEVSSVASFSFGAIGAGLYFHWLNHLLYAQTRLWDEIRSTFGDSPGTKARWMAASYNQGGPATVLMLRRHGENFQAALRPDVAEYTRRVTAACATLQGGEPLPEIYLTWGVYSDFLEELRWTYSAIPINWEALRPYLERRFFRGESVPLSRVGAIFDGMAAWDSRLAAEEPVLDFKMGYERY